MDRGALATYLTVDLDVSLAEAGIALTDTPDGLAPILDRVERFVEGNASIGDAWLPDLARYVALARIADRLMMNMRISVGGSSFSLKDQYDNVILRLKEAKAVVAWIVDPAPPASTSNGPVSIDMPYLAEGDGSW